MQFNLPEVATVERSENGVEFPIISLKTGEPYVVNGVAVRITILGPDSKAFHSFVREQSQRVMKERELDPKKEIDQDALELERLAYVTKGWQMPPDESGQPIPCTPENALQLYRQIPVVRDQVSNRFNNRANFIAASSTN